jgi:multicomponent Na+:H+ antiporter subunit F
MFDLLLKIALLGVSLSMIGFLYRLIKGPSVPDRVVALDAMGINLIAIVALASIVMDTSAYLEAILLLGVRVTDKENGITRIASAIWSCRMAR